MYSLTSANRYYLYQGFVRMNLGIDGLFKIIRSQMKELSPISGDIFLFFGKNLLLIPIRLFLPSPADQEASRLICGLNHSLNIQA